MSFVIHWVESCSEDESIFKVQTPAGNLILFMHGDVLSQADWEFAYSPAQIVKATGEHDIQRQLNQYWSDLEKPIHIKLLKQGSDFRNKVWAELCRIPFGETITYSALARRIGTAARAVGNACRDNPFPLIIPCHRVVSVSGMGGYSGQTKGDFMAIKSKLLAFEAAHKK
jgi:methylated-DNA-[protein]-cysteine S-methyltransferase